MLYDQILSQPLRSRLDIPIVFPQQHHQQQQHQNHQTTSSISSPSSSPPPSKTLLSSSPPLMNHYQHHNNRNNNNRSPPPPSSGERIHVARVEKKRYPPCSNDHIIEATLMSGHQAPKITRASNTESATIDDGYIAPTTAPSYSRCSEDRLLWSMDSSPKVNFHIHLFFA